MFLTLKLSKSPTNILQCLAQLISPKYAFAIKPQLNGKVSIEYQGVWWVVGAIANYLQPAEIK